VIPARPLTNPTDRSISPMRRTKTTPNAIVAVPAAWMIRLLKFVALTKLGFLE
jgi:hypothetical protein